MPRVTLYSKPGCHLCEVARAVILQAGDRFDFAMEVVNILTSAAAYERYKNDVPVVLVDGVEVARHRVTPASLDAALSIPAFAGAPGGRIVTARSPLGGVTLVVMAKVPAAGRVKTRLTPALTPEQAAAVHGAFLSHVTGRLARLAPRELVVCHAPPDAAEAMKRVVQRNCPAAVYVGQRDGDLGQRLAGATDELRAGVDPPPDVLFVGVDSPDVPVAHLATAAGLLSDADVVVGPTEDGGYWCLGLSARVTDPHALLAGIAWSSGRERAQTLDRARSLGWTTAEAPAWDDVDHVVDLRRLTDRLAGSVDVDDRALRDRLRALLPEGRW